MLIEYPLKTSQTQHEKITLHLFGILLLFKNAIHVEVRILTLIHTDTTARK